MIKIDIEGIKEIRESLSELKKLFLEKKRDSGLLKFRVAIPVGNFLIIGQKLKDDLP